MPLRGIVGCALITLTATKAAFGRRGRGVAVGGNSPRLRSPVTASYICRAFNPFARAYAPSPNPADRAASTASSAERCLSVNVFLVILHLRVVCAA